MIRKISTISTLLLLVALFWGCAAKQAEKKSDDKKKTDTKLTQPKEQVPDDGTIVLDPTGEPKKSGSKPVKPLVPIKPNIRTNDRPKSIIIPDPDPTQPRTSPPPETTSSPEEQEEGDYTVVQIFYGTDRERTTGPASHPLGRIPWVLFAMATGSVTLLATIFCCFWRRSKKGFMVPLILLFLTGGFAAGAVIIPTNTKPAEADTSVAYNGNRGKLELGTCDVSIPKIHKLAELESPSILRFEFVEDTSKHVVLLKVDPMEESDFIDKLRKRVQEGEGQEAFVFIHGYNVTFENAARRTAQLAYDLRFEGFEGTPILYSWPSQGSLGGYMVDENNVEWTVSHLKNFLRMIAKQSGAKEVHLIAHSMGNRALTRALEKLSYSDAKDGPIFSQVVLSAPDIDAGIFRELAQQIIKTAKRVTLYASSNDKALIASKKVHGFPRAGESGEDVTIVPGIDTIDVSGLDTSLLGHSYYGSNDTVLIDMAELLLESKPPTLRGRLEEKIFNKLKYWVFMAKKLHTDLKESGI